VRLTINPKSKLNVDLRVAQIAGNIVPEVDLRVRSRSGLQISYGF